MPSSISYLPAHKPSPSYWALLVFRFSLPTFLDAWRQFIVSSSYSSLLLSIHRSIKFVCKCFCLLFNSSRTNASEIGRALRLAHTSRLMNVSEYTDNITPNHDPLEGRGAEEVSNTLAIWRIDWALRHSLTLKVSSKIKCPIMDRRYM